MPTIRQLYQGRIVDLRLEEAELPNGRTASLEIVHHPGAAAVVAIDDARRVILIHQYRHAAGGFIWEVPAGTLHDGEEPATCAARELEEETAMRAGEILPLGHIFTTPGFCNERIHLFLARSLEPLAGQRLDHDEVLSVEPIPFARALEMIREGEIRDAKSIAALHLAQPHVFPNR